MSAELTQQTLPGVPLEDVLKQLTPAELRDLVLGQGRTINDQAARLRAIEAHPALPEVVGVGTDDAPTLFELPRHIPPGATFVVRRADGVGFGMEEEFDWLHVTGPDDWSAAREIADGHAAPVEFEMVMLTPTTISKRTFGRGSLRGEGAA